MDTVYDLPLLVVQAEGASLLGSDWFASLGICQKSTGRDALPPFLDEFCSVFDAYLRCCTRLSVHVVLLVGATPKFLKASPVPFVFRPAVEAELD